MIRLDRPDDPGQRKWDSYDMPVPGGPSAGYEAVWEEPASGRVALRSDAQARSSAALPTAMASPDAPSELDG